MFLSTVTCFFTDNLYALNIADPQKSALILENKSRRSEFFSNLCYLKENQTLYFAVHTGKYFENGSQTFESEGLYVLKKVFANPEESKSYGTFLGNHDEYANRLGDWESGMTEKSLHLATAS